MSVSVDASEPAHGRSYPAHELVDDIIRRRDRHHHVEERSRHAGVVCVKEAERDGGVVVPALLGVGRGRKGLNKMGVSNPFEFDCPLIFHFIKTNQNMMLCFIGFANEFM